MTTKGLITAEEAATLLGVRRPTVYAWVRQGLIPCYRVGKRLLKFDPVELMTSFKVEQSPMPPRPQKFEVTTLPLAEPFRALERDGTAGAKKQSDRYRAMIRAIK